jgi:non-heme chloroperoxidase
LIVPIAVSALLAATLPPSATPKVYAGLPHGMCATHPQIVNPDLLDFVRG